MSYQAKYLKYKNKYLTLKNQVGGCPHNPALQPINCPICTPAVAAALRQLQVQVQLMTGDILVTNIRINATVLGLKQRIHAMHQILVEQQKLFIEGPAQAPIILNDANTLASYGIGNTTIVHMYIIPFYKYSKSIANGALATGHHGDSTKMCLTSNGELIISDKRDIVVYNATDGTFLRNIRGVDDNRFAQPCDICVSSNNELFVTDSNNNVNTRVLVFRVSDGAYLRKIDLPRQIIYEDDLFHIYISDADELYINNNNEHCVYVYSTAGQLLRTIRNPNIEWYGHLCVVSSTDELLVPNVDLDDHGGTRVFRASTGTYLDYFPNLELNGIIASYDNKIYSCTNFGVTIHNTDYSLYQNIRMRRIPTTLCISPEGHIFVDNKIENCIDVYTL